MCEYVYIYMYVMYCIPTISYPNDIHPLCVPIASPLNPHFTTHERSPMEFPPFFLAGHAMRFRDVQINGLEQLFHLVGVQASLGLSDCMCQRHFGQAGRW